MSVRATGARGGSAEICPTGIAGRNVPDGGCSVLSHARRGGGLSSQGHVDESPAYPLRHGRNYPVPATLVSARV
jgi:hypothetical protein